MGNINKEFLDNVTRLNKKLLGDSYEKGLTDVREFNNLLLLVEPKIVKYLTSKVAYSERAFNKEKDFLLMTFLGYFLSNSGHQMIKVGNDFFAEHAISIYTDVFVSALSLELSENPEDFYDYYGMDEKEFGVFKTLVENWGFESGAVSTAKNILEDGYEKMKAADPSNEIEVESFHLFAEMINNAVKRALKKHTGETKERLIEKTGKLQKGGLLKESSDDPEKALETLLG